MPPNISTPINKVNVLLIFNLDKHTYKIDNMKYGERLRTARDYAKLSQVQLAERAGVSQSTVSQLEKSDTDVGSVNTVRLARACGVSPDWLDDEIGEMVPIVYQTSDPKIIAALKVMEPLSDFGKDAAVKSVTEIAQLIAHIKQGGNGTDG